MLRKIGAALVATAAAGALTTSATPASALELCDPNRFVCIQALDQGCPGGYQSIGRVPSPTGDGVLFVICVLR